jgi:hypothetical protein
MATVIKTGGIQGSIASGAGRLRVGELLRHASTRLFYAILGVAGVLLWLLMQLPLGNRAKSTLVAVMAGCFGIFVLGWRLLAEQAAGMRRS